MEFDGGELELSIVGGDDIEETLRGTTKVA
jgi:hypothetical protein